MRHAIRLALCLVLFGVASVTTSQAQASRDKDTCNFNNVPELNEDRYSLSPLEEKWLQVRDVRSKSQNLSKIQQKRVQAAQDEVFRLSTRVEQLARSVDDYQPQQEQIDRDREALGKLEKEREQLAANRKTSKDALDDLDYRIRLLKTAISTAEAIEAENARVTRELQTQLERSDLVDSATGSIVIPWNVTAYGLHRESYLIKEMLLYGRGRGSGSVELCQSDEDSFVFRLTACFRD